MTKILFISRAYPPIVGGIENQNYELHQWLAKIAEVKSIINKRGKFFLPLFIPYAIWRALFLMWKYDVVLLGDGVLAFIGWKLKFLTKKPVICVIHGLDLTYKMKIYQWFWVKCFIKKMDRLIAVGHETIKIGVKKGIPEDKFVFIPNGVDPAKCPGNYTREDLQQVLKTNLGDKKVILTSGRLVKRKGVAWFVREVLPKLPENIIYAVSGDGPDFANISRTVEEKKLSDRVEMLGYVSDKVRNILFNTCDVFVQPNIKIEGDVEGFGISVIEAASCRIPVIASNLEGLKDAIKDGENGFLVESGNSEAWTGKIKEILVDDNFRREFGIKASRYVMENYSWEKIAQRYLEEIEKVVRK
ncbi:MAG: glycosyltransferase family 4 protein [Candidatus Moranbacteria bacterium]|nr:glycosyltransferase family 4 protein [Candidatus Moranbacteria bacterium]